MKTKCLLFVILMLLITLISGCSNEGDKYIGKWTGLSNPNNPLSDLRQVTIEKNSENNFIINEKIGSYNAYGKKCEWKENTSTDIATLKYGKLVIGGTSFTYIEKDNTLLYNGDGKYYLKKDDDDSEYTNLKKQAEPLAIERFEKYKAQEKELNTSPFERYGKTKW